MYKKLKKTVVIVLLFSFLMLTSCENEMLVHRQEIQDVAEEAMEYFVNKDMDSLIEMFSVDIQENNREEIEKQLEEMYEFIDGKIVSYTYDGEGGVEISKNDGKIDYYDAAPRFVVVTDNDKEYVVKFLYYYIWDEMPEREGIGKIYVDEKGNWKNTVRVGEGYYREEN